MGIITTACLCLVQSAAGLTVPADLIQTETRAVELAEDGTLWLGVSGGRLARITRDGLTWVGEADLLPDGIAGLADVDGSLWVVGLGGASVRDSAGRFEPENVEGLDPRVVFSASSGAQPGVVWLATSSGAIRIGPNVERYTTEAGLPHDVVHDVIDEGDRGVWFLCRTGLAHLRDGRLEVLWPELNFRAGLIGPDGFPWFGTSDGLLRWTGTDWVHELEGMTVYPATVGADGAVWAGSARNGVFRYFGGSWTRIPLPAREGLEVFDVAEAKDGTIWVATATGVVRLDPAGIAGSPS